MFLFCTQYNYVYDFILKCVYVCIYIYTLQNKIIFKE